MESLVKAGAFDRFGNRSTLLHNLDMILAYAARLQKQASSGQTDIFGNSSQSLIDQPRLELQPPPDSADTREQLLWERELLGLYLSQHPLELFETFLAEQTVPLNSLTPDHDGKSVAIGGAVTDVREITTKNGQRMAFVKIEDKFGEIEAVLFPNSFQQTLGLWDRDRVVLVRGKLSARSQNGTRGEEVKIMVDDAREITSQQAAAYEATGKKAKSPRVKAKAAVPYKKEPKPHHERVYIRLASSSDQQVLLSLKKTIDSHQGETEVVLVLGGDTSKQAIKLPGGIDRQSDGLVKLQELVGTENLVVR